MPSGDNVADLPNHKAKASSGVAPRMRLAFPGYDPATRDGPTMTDFLRPRTEQIKAYRKTNLHRLWLANLLLELEWELCSLLINCREGEFEPWIQVNVQTIHEYHCENFLFLMRGKPVLAMAMMRMACELARDIFRIAEDQKRLTLWLDTSRQNRRVRTDVFRFDENDPGEKVLFKCWDFCSTFGVHRHFDMPGNAVPYEHRGGSFVTFDTDPKQVNDLFIITLTTVLFYTSTAASKLKPIFELQTDSLQRAYDEFASSYFGRAEPVDRFIKAQRSRQAATTC
jgi:hypothetical protein